MMFPLSSTPRRTFGAVASLSAFGFALAGASCGSKANGSGGTDCAANPTLCPPGQTCWPINATTMGCIASLSSASVGASCVEQYDQATCGDGLICDSTDPSGAGVCAQYCGPTSACPAGYSCNGTHVGTNGPSVNLCRFSTGSTTPTEDGGQPGSIDEAGPLPDISFIPDALVDVTTAHQ
jgi:hypothetical protein